MKSLKKEKHFFTFKTFLVMLFMSFGALLYIWQHIVIIQLGYEIEKHEASFEELVDEKTIILSSVSRMESPAQIQKFLDSFDLKLSVVKNPKIVRVKL